MELSLAVKQREFLLAERRYRNGIRPSSGNGYLSPYTNSRLTGRQYTVSDGHPWPSQKGQGRDIGGYFFTQRDGFESIRSKTGKWEGRPDFFGNVPYVEGTLGASYFPNFTTLRASGAVSSILTLNGMGATAISRCIPTAPASDAMVFLGETLKEGLPKMVGAQLLKDKGKDFRSYGSEYLNYQFGIAPVLSDLRSFADTARNANKILEQYERDSGRNIRRSYHFPTIESTESRIELGAVPPGATNDILRTRGVRETVTTVTRDVWFKGCFTYHLSLDSSKFGKMRKSAQELKRLYGIRADPSVVWNLTPWSWAADWAANAGDVMTNLSAFSQDGLVMRYGYIMETRKVTVDTYLRGCEVYNGPDISYLHDRASVTTKIRHAASPFGFGLNPDTFTTRQWSILAALGISNAPRKV